MNYFFHCLLDLFYKEVENLDTKVLKIGVFSCNVLNFFVKIFVYIHQKENINNFILLFDRVIL